MALVVERLPSKLQGLGSVTGTTVNRHKRTYSSTTDINIRMVTVKELTRK
jgi:hypothetical protein